MELPASLSLLAALQSTLEIVMLGGDTRVQQNVLNLVLAAFFILKGILALIRCAIVVIITCAQGAITCTLFVAVAYYRRRCCVKLSKYAGRHIRVVGIAIC